MRIPKYSEFRHVQIEIVDDIILQLRDHNGGMKGISLKVLTSQNCKQLIGGRTKTKSRPSPVHSPVHGPVHSPFQSPESSFYRYPKTNDYESIVRVSVKAGLWTVDLTMDWTMDWTRSRF